MKEHAVFGRGWIVYLPDGGMIRHRMKLDYVTGIKGSRRKLPPGHPQWLLSARWIKGTGKWFETLEDAMVWAVNEMAMKDAAELL